MISIQVNGKDRQIDVEADAPLLWVLREELGLTGTKFGCGAGLCGACTVHLGGDAVRSCQVPLGEVGSKSVTTIEGLAQGQPHPLQAAWIEGQVPQCGYCQPGMIMAAVALLRGNASPSEPQIRDAITNICRCGTYPRIVAAIRRAAKEAK